jgi:hypothetical protein
LDEEIEDVEVLLIDEGNVNVETGDGLVFAETEPLVVEDVMEDNKEDSNASTDVRTHLPSRSQAVATTTPSGYPDLDMTRASTASESTVRAVEVERPSDSSEPPSMELWDCLLTQMMGPTTSHGENATDDGTVVARRQNGTLMEVTLSGSCSETSSSSSEASSPQSRSDLPSTLPLP